MNILKSKRTIIAIILAILITLIYLLINGFDKTIYFCDAFFVSGFTLIALGGLSSISNAGGFDIFTYSFSYVFTPKEKRKYSTMGDYVESRSEIRKKAKWDFLPYIFVGLIFVLLAIVLRLVL